MQEYFTHILPNGLRVIHKPSNSSVSYSGFIVNVGTRDEDEDEWGMAHFIEHMIFKGTKTKSSRKIIDRIEGVGGEINAYTNKEETVLYSIFLEQHFERAFELMSDMMFNSQFPQAEIDKESEVIIDEIHSYEDSPSELIYDEFENQIFRNSQLGHNILGTEDSVASFDTTKAKRFYQKYYTPANMVFFSYGKTDFAKIVKLAEKHLPQIIDNDLYINRLTPSFGLKQHQKDDKDTSQAHVILGTTTFDIHHPDRKALFLLNNILGGPCMSSRLNISLREKKGYVYNVESSLTSYSDTGLISVYFGTDKKNVDKCLRLVHKEIDLLRDTKLKPSQLAAAKRQVIGQIGVNSDNNESVALALGKSFMRYNHYDSLEQTIEKIERITEDDLHRVANTVFDPEKLSSLIYY